MKILLVEDDTLTVSLLTEALNSHNYNVNAAADSETA